MKRIFSLVVVFTLGIQGLNCGTPVDYQPDGGVACTDGDPCSDNDPCTQTDTCQAGLCIGANPMHCDIGFACSQGACISVTCPAQHGFPGSPIQYLDSYAYDLVAKDLNGDNIIDIAVSEGKANHVGVLFGVGDGTFGPQADYLAGTTPLFIDAADLDNDGAMDLVVVNQESNDVSILMNTGNGTFATKVDYAAGTNPVAIRIADVNGDNKPDAVIANSIKHTVSVLVNNGDGTLAPKTDYDAGCMLDLTAIDVADLNGDGNLDIAAGCRSEPLKLFHNDGTGGFVPSNATILGIDESQWYNDIAAADFNGDGRIDLAATRGDVGALDVIQNDGGNSFTTKPTYVGRYLDSLTITDVNRDGAPDIGTTDIEGNCRVFTNAGNFAFTKTEYGAIIDNIRAADVNGDNMVDFLGTTHSGFGEHGTGLAVLLNHGSELAAPHAIFYDDYPHFRSFQVHDVTGDRRADIIANYRNDAQSARGIVVMPGHDDGSFEDRVLYPTLVEPYDTTLMDLNHDGKLDIISSFNSIPTLTTMLNLGDGTFEAAKVFCIDTNAGTLRAGDFNNDGFDDLATINGETQRMSILFHSGKESLVRNAEYVTGAGPHDIEVLNFDHDADLDILVFDGSSPQVVSFFENQGNGTFAPRVDIPLESALHQYHVIDVNGDGHFDIVGPNSNADSVDVLLNNGDGTFAQAIHYPTIRQPWGSTVADFNGDQQPDILVSNFSEGSVRMHFNQGGGVYNAHLDYPSVHAPVSVFADDVNGDLKPDFVLRGFFSSSVHLNNCVP